MTANKSAHLDTAAVTMGGGAAVTMGGETSAFGARAGPVPAALPGTIGRYGVVRLIGSGGMGAVYEAVQDQPKRTVALKVMRASLGSGSLLRRFEYESQLLARLRHPGIAQVYDAGTHRAPDTGELVPYFAMEYIPDAAPLTTFARVKGLETRLRLELFVRVCSAVQHAHERGVIHRDLKPANILVDPGGQPKVIDFGVAYDADGEKALVTMQTDQAPLIGTLQYMSPEQCALGGAEVDARSDVFALGLILYELLTEHSAYEFAGKPLPAVLAAVREASIPPPSAHRPALRGDLDTIVLKACQRERSGRYESAAALAADVERHLRFEPILARPLGPLGRARRWVRRNTAVSVVGAASLAVLLVVSTLLVARIVRETRRANENLREAERNLRVADERAELTKGLFASMRPNELHKGLVDVEQIFDASAAKLAASPPQFAETEASFRELLAEGYQGLGLYGKSIGQQRKVIELRELQAGGSQSVELAASLHKLAAALWWNGQYDEAGALYERSLEMRRALKSPDREIAMSLTHLAAYRLRQGRLRDAEELYKRALDLRQALRRTAKPEEAPAAGAEVAASLNNLAKPIGMRGDFPRAESLFREAHALITSVAGPADIRTASAAFNLAGCLLDAGKPDEAEPFAEQSYEIRRTKLREGHHQANQSRFLLARVRFARSPSADRIRDAEAALAMIRKELPAGHPEVAEALALLGRMQLELGEAEAAEAALREAVSEAAGVSMPVRERAIAHLALGECLAHRGQRAEAERHLRLGLRALEAAPDLSVLRGRLEDALAKLTAGGGT